MVRDTPSRSPGAERLLRHLRRRAFGMGVPARPRRIGAEVEVIPVDDRSGLAVPIRAASGLATLPLVRRFAERAGWRERPHSAGPPRFHTPDGGVVSWEPGGQIELASAPLGSVAELVRALHGVMMPLREFLLDAGVRLVSAGVDPMTPLAAAPMQLASNRYPRMAEHLSRNGPAGAVMMRQSASYQISLDWEGETVERWRMLNAGAPYLLALFANSSVHAGVPTGFRSVRAQAWRELDPTRTGVLPAGDDPAAEYLDFALGATAFLMGDGEPLPFGVRLARGEVTAADWRVHLTTLFPEVRPRGFAEFRSLDAIEPEWYAAPLALLAGLVLHPPSRAGALEITGDPDPELLTRAGQRGLGDPLLAARTAELVEIGLRGASALHDFVDSRSIETAGAWYARAVRTADGVDRRAAVSGGCDG